MRFGIGLAILLTLLACNPGGRMQGSHRASETASTAGPDSTGSSIDTAVMETEDDSAIANEPVAIGGAFLTCSYKSGQPQGSATYSMDCEIGPTAEVTSAITQAEFFKIDSQGVRTALDVVTSDLDALKWTLLETASTLPYNRVEAVLSATNATPASLTTTLSGPLVLTPTLSFWLGGEPNNLMVTNPDGEDCVEFGNIASKNDHQTRTGLSVGTYGRLNDISCTSRISSFLCRSLANDTAAKWRLSTTKGTYAESTGACPVGYGFGFPLNEKEITEVGALIDGNPAIQNIWVNMNDRAEEGKFSVSWR